MSLVIPGSFNQVFTFSRDVLLYMAIGCWIVGIFLMLRSYRLMKQERNRAIIRRV